MWVLCEQRQLQLYRSIDRSRGSSSLRSCHSAGYSVWGPDIKMKWSVPLGSCRGAAELGGRQSLRGPDVLLGQALQSGSLSSREAGVRFTQHEINDRMVGGLQDYVFPSGFPREEWEEGWGRWGGGGGEGVREGGEDWEVRSQTERATSCRLKGSHMKHQNCRIMMR